MISGVSLLPWVQVGWGWKLMRVVQGWHLRSLRWSSQRGLTLILRGERTALDCQHNPPSCPQMRSMDQALVGKMKSEMNHFGKNPLTCSPGVEGRCIKLIVIVAKLAVCICETKFDILWCQVGEIMDNVLDVVL
jgi:hypothetical protein